MQTKIQKWGNSLGLRLPKALAAQLGITDGAVIELSLQGDHLVLQPIQRPRYRLVDLMKKYPKTKRSKTPELEWGKPLGNEEW